MAEKSIELDSVEIAAAVFGNCDRNIRLLEKEFSVTAVCRGTQLRISGEAANVAAATRAIEGMLLLIENHTPLEEQTVRYCLSLAHDGEEKRVKELTEDFVTVTVKGRPIRPKTLGQPHCRRQSRCCGSLRPLSPAVFWRHQCPAGCRPASRC